MVSTDLSKSTKRITLAKFKEIKTRVDKYLNDGGKATSTSRVCPDDPDPSTYILYSQWQNIVKRYEAFVKKNGREPKTIQIYVEASDLSNTGSKIPLSTFLDMKARVDSFIAAGGKPEYNRRIYLDFTTQMDYVTYSTYLAMLKKYSDFVAKNSRQPNYITTTKSSSSTPIITTKDCYRSPKSGIKIPLNTFLDMKTRVDNFIAGGGKPTNDRKIYLNFKTKTDHVVYSEYLKMLKKYTDFLASKGRQPNYITTTKSGSSTPIITTKDCYRSPRWYSGSNIVQDTLWYCGCNTVQQIMEELTDIFYSEKSLAKIMGTTKSGTGPSEIVACLKKLLKANGYTIKKCEWVYLSDYSWDNIGKMIADPKIGIGLHSVYKLRWGHYEYPIKLCKSSETITIANSLSGGYLEPRSFSTMKKYANAGSYPSLLIVQIE